MKVLFIVPYMPNPIRVRSYQFIRTLLQRGHRVTVATLWTNQLEREESETLIKLGAELLAEPMPVSLSLFNSLRAGLHAHPLQAYYSWNPKLFARIRACLETDRFDAVHIEHLRGSRYGVEILKLLREKTNPPVVVWDSVDCISYLFEQASNLSKSLTGRFMSRLELAQTRRLEGQLVGLFDHIVVTSHHDQAALSQLAQKQQKHGASPGNNPADRISVIANGVDLDYFAACDSTRSATPVLVFTGKMSYHANVTSVLHLAHDIMPLIWAQKPDVQLWLVGKDPTSEIQALANTSHANASHANTSHANRAVVVTGTVTDVSKYLQTATISVAPIVYGAGVQNKVLEAMACATPVVASQRAVDALDVQNGRELMIADGAEHFAHTVISLLDNPEQREALAKQGRAYVESHHSWSAAVEKLEELYQARREK